jgi:hypothetical protein
MIVTINHIIDREQMTILVDINDDTSGVLNCIEVLMPMLSGKLNNGPQELILV